MSENDSRAHRRDRGVSSSSSRGDDRPDYVSLIADCGARADAEFEYARLFDVDHRDLLRDALHDRRDLREYEVIFVVGENAAIFKAAHKRRERATIDAEEVG